MDDRNFNDYLAGVNGVNTGGLMNSIARGTVYSRPTRDYAPKSRDRNKYYVPPEPRPLTEADKKRIEARRLRQNRLDALPQTSMYRKWSFRFGTLNYWIECVGKYVLGGATLITLSSFIAFGVWRETDWANFLVITMFTGLIALPIMVYVMYAAHILSPHGTNHIKTMSVLNDFSRWTLPFCAVYAAFQLIFLFLLLGWPVAFAWYVGVFFNWW
jgi:hypothetical protein